MVSAFTIFGVSTRKLLTQTKKDMFKKNQLQFLETLLSTPSPTGYETAGQKVWIDYINRYSDKVETDFYGSAAAFLSVDPDAITVMIEAHCDEIGMVVQYIDDSGFLYITKIGGSDPTIARARKVNIHTRQGIVTGVIGNTAIHLQNRTNQKAPEWKDLFVDIGVSSGDEAKEMVQVGDPITYADDVEFLTDDLVVGRALDNRIGGFIIAHALGELFAKRKDLNVNVIALNSVQEEIGGFGARMMAHRLRPDVALVTDVTHATDTPGINKKEHGSTKLGKGPVVTHGTANQLKVVEFLEMTATNHKIEIQHEASSVRTGTDTDSIFFSRNGIPSALISTPMRYMHSPTEMISLEDAFGVSELMQKAILGMKKKQSFNLF